MRVLHFFDGRRNNTRIIQIEFMKMLKDFCDFFVYGPGEYKQNTTEVSPLKFDGDIPFEDIVRIFNPDVIIFPEYLVTKNLFKRFGNVKNIEDLPKISMEVDYYNVINNLGWYKESGINFIINRGPYNKSEYTLPNVWLPWSAHNMFFVNQDSNYLDNRINKMVFVGGGRYSPNKYYSTRQKAIRVLEEHSLLDYFDSVPPITYKNIISSYTSALGCSFAGLRKVPAKIFEITACGTLFLTTESGFENILFGDKQCLITYKEDCSDLIEKVIKIHNDKDLIKDITKNALEVVNKNHLHTHRIVELYNILKALVEGKEVPRKWGI